MSEQSLCARARAAFIKKKQLSLKYSKSKRYADIVAINNDGEEVYYEIKATKMKRDCYNSIRQKDKYFGAATLTEFNLAIKHPDRYFFVLVIMDEDSPEEMIDSVEYSVLELLSYSTIPPFKINFNIPYVKPSRIPSQPRNNSARKSVPAFIGDKPNFGRIEILISDYCSKLEGNLLSPFE